MIGSTFCPQMWHDVESSKVGPNVFGITGTATNSTTTTIDTLISDDSLIRGIEFSCKDQAFNDTVTMQVVDIDNVYGHGAGYVLATPVTNYTICADRQKQGGYEAVIPKKIPGLTYLRIIYTSTGASDVTIGLNVLALTVLV